jgi:type II secretory pathway pseudopilin PulG
MTLPELMIASSILLVCLVSLAGLLGGAIASSSMTRARDEATNLANERLESARNLPYDSVGIKHADGTYGDPAGKIVTPETVRQFTVTTECSWVQALSDVAAYKKLRVVVAWTSPFAGQVEANTMVYGRTGITGSGDLLVQVAYRENQNAVTGREVTIVDSSNITRLVTTNSRGEALFGQVPVGPCTLSVSPPPGCIVDGSTLTGAAVSTDSVSSALVYVQQPAQATVVVTDMSGAPLSDALVSVRRSDGAVASWALSDASGIASFSEILYGEYAATVTRDSYASATQPFSVAYGASSPTVTFRMSSAPTHGIRVRVFDSNGTQVPDANVTVTNASGAVVGTGTTGTNGEVAFSPLAIGAYTVAVSKSGYAGATQVATLHEEHDEETLSFTLSAAAANGNMHILTYGTNKKLASYWVVISVPDGYFANDLRSDGSGELTVTNLIPGTYSANLRDSRASAVTVVINSNQTTEVKLDMK